MKHMCNQPRFWKRPTTFLIITATMATAVILMSPGGLEAQTGLPAHDNNQTSQHQNLSGQGTTHDSAQTTQHNGLSSQITNVRTAVDNLSTSADHSGLPPAWDKTLPANDSTTPDGCNSSRFTCVMGGAAVLDRETGLVWEQSPSTTTPNWVNAQIGCNQKTVGNRKGWRLPTIQELASLIDPTVFSPALPAGHPFSNVQSSVYWSATSSANFAGNAWNVHFNVAFVGTINKANVLFVWCVRGGQGVDPQ